MDNVCRLCLTTNDLVWIFDERIVGPGNMKEVIFITTGVEIKTTDDVTQKVCKKCCQVTIKMFKFRTTALKNDRELKNKVVQMLKQVNPPKETQTVDHNASTIQIQTSQIKYSQEPAKTNKAHETVTKLLCRYPGLKIPRSCVKSNVNPTIALNRGEVSIWFEEKKKRDALKEKKVEVLNKPQKVENSNLNRITNSLVQPYKKKSLIEDFQKNKVANLILMNKINSETTSTDSRVSQPQPGKRKLYQTTLDSFQKKRKLSTDTTSSCSTDPDKEELFTKLGLTDKIPVKENVDTELLSHINKSTSVNICNLCNAVIYSNKEMKLHSRKHMTCPFCKVRFRSLEAKSIHVEKECPIQTVLRNLPTIPLVRVEEMESFTSKYYRTFKEVLGLQIENGNIKAPEDLDDCVEIITVDDEVLYISDDDSDLKSPLKEAIPVEVSGLKKEKPDEESTTESQSTSTMLLNENNAEANNHNSSSVVSKVIPLESTKASLVKPESNILQPVITMQNDPLFNTVKLGRSESDLLKKLLKAADSTVQLPKPSNENIVIQGNSDRIYALKTIVPYLKKYKIPIKLSHGSKLNVEFDLDPPHPVTYQMKMWKPNTTKISRGCVVKKGATNNIGIILKDLLEGKNAYPNNTTSGPSPTTVSSTPASTVSGATSRNISTSPTSVLPSPILVNSMLSDCLVNSVSRAAGTAPTVSFSNQAVRSQDSLQVHSFARTLNTSNVSSFQGPPSSSNNVVPALTPSSQTGPMIYALLTPISVLQAELNKPQETIRVKSARDLYGNNNK